MKVASTVRRGAVGKVPFTRRQLAGCLPYLAASVTGDLSFRDENSVTVGNVAGVAGIRSQGRNVALESGGVLTVSAAIDTRPGDDGRLITRGNPQRIRVLVQPVLGGGDVTLTAT